jgi:anti-anti-sigma factor
MSPMARTLATMAIELQQGSAGPVAVARLATDPQFTADLESIGQLDFSRPACVVLDFAGVRYINSSNLSRLLRLRKRLIEADGKLVLCNLPAQVASVFQVTGLDRVFTFAADVNEALKLSGK